MADVDQGEKVFVTARKYPEHYYSVRVYKPSHKVDLRVIQGMESVALKMSKAEVEELIVRLQFAIMDA
jgi:hypothetical protein